jgi:hypothetical protein
VWVDREGKVGQCVWETSEQFGLLHLLPSNSIPPDIHPTHPPSHTHDSTLYTPILTQSTPTPTPTHLLF